MQKDVTPTFTRTYLWKISKDVDKTTATSRNGGTATFNYTVDVEQTGITDSGWKISGTITVTNPNTSSRPDVTERR